MGKAHSKYIARMERADARHTCQSKVHYDSFEVASIAASHIRQRLKLRFPPTVYVCSVCSGYHLTSKSPGR